MLQLMIARAVFTVWGDVGCALQALRLSLLPLSCCFPRAGRGQAGAGRPPRRGRQRRRQGRRGQRRDHRPHRAGHQPPPGQPSGTSGCPRYPAGVWDSLWVGTELSWSCRVCVCEQLGMGKPATPGRGTLSICVNLGFFHHVLVYFSYS